MPRVEPAYRLSVVSAPAALPVSVAEVKSQARLVFPGEADPFDGAEDTLISMYIQAAVDELDAPLGWLGRSLVTRTLRMSWDAAPPTRIRLPGPPVSAVVQVVATDADGVETVVDAADYKTDLASAPALLWAPDGWPATWSYPGRLKIDYTAGYGAATDVPDILRTWIAIKAATLYAQREALVVGTSVAPLQHVERMLDNWRVV